ncbi:MAG TPA: HD domain-containing phosphohydrolase [Methylomirabilota bacterium]|jgi:HD-GYP domain-containing protein (c-di-GMP phosphodiesterase class II)|nr:HD domain-containing phosphohydrolase [Methylomirabilota bacterium]
MPRQVIWFLAGSPVAAVLGALPPDLEPLPLPLRELPSIAEEDCAAFLFDVDGDDPAAVAEAAARIGGVPVVALVDTNPSDAPALPCYAYLTKPVAPLVLATTLRNACEHARLAREAEEARRQLEELNAIGVRLTAERDTDALLELILTKAREITRSDAGSLYLVEEPEDGPRRLRFKLAQNDSVTVPFREFTLPISEKSVAGYVALSGQMLHLDDAYLLPPGTPFRINRDFDDTVGYRTKSMLVIAMRTPPGETIGVLQLINCKQERGWVLDSAEAVDRGVLPYPARFRDLAASLASQAAVALENSRLYESIQTLFEGFVQASVTAIESRDPTTSGHSFRVADLTVALAQAVDRSQGEPFRRLRFSSAEMRELRYASLLHDFGKVGVREEVLVKAKKLQPWHLELIRLRGEIIKRGLEIKRAERKLDHLLREGVERFAENCAAWDAELLGLVAELQQSLKTVAAANEPSVMPEDFGTTVRDLAVRAFVDHLGERHTVVTPEEARILSIPRGSLTEDEYREIQSHVLHTFQFLSQIPWTKELRRVPHIARAHHEKLDGSGYPGGQRGGEIPIQSRMMTIADIFDALTASDRPYKAAIPVARALDILDHERRAGTIDSALLGLFIDLRPWERRPS